MLLGAARYLVPYLRPFPIWRYGARYDAIDGHYIDDGWFPDPFGEWIFRTAEDVSLTVPPPGLLKP